MSRLPLPPLVQRAPLCPVCAVAVESLDSRRYRCPTCEARWDSDAYDAEGRANPDVDQCTAEIAPYVDCPTIRHYRYQCCRDAGHPIGQYVQPHVGQRIDADPDGDPYEWNEDGT